MGAWGVVFSAQAGEKMQKCDWKRWKGKGQILQILISSMKRTIVLLPLLFWLQGSICLAAQGGIGHPLSVMCPLFFCVQDCGLEKTYSVLTSAHLHMYVCICNIFKYTFQNIHTRYRNPWATNTVINGVFLFCWPLQHDKERRTLENISGKKVYKFMPTCKCAA